MRFLIASALVLAACSKAPAPVSATDFLPGSGATKVIVEAADLADTFLFGAIVTDIDAVTPPALIGINSDLAKQVKLKLVTISGAKYLSINDATSGARIIAFKVSSSSSAATEVDFSVTSSAIKSIESIGIKSSMITGSSVTNVLQSKDKMAVDVAYSAGTAQFSVRYWWTRRQPDASFVQRGNTDGIGYFTSAGMGAGDIRSGNIDRLDLDRGPIKFTLVNFPDNFVDVGTRAIKAWELALGPNTITVDTATDGNVGDPNSIVVRWYPVLPDAVSFAGLTYDSGDPVTGERAVSAVLINGSPIQLYQKIYNDTASSYRAFLSRQTVPTGAPTDGLISSTGDSGSVDASAPVLELGGLKLARSPLMMDVALPFLPDATVSFDDYMQGYYYDVIIHEVGHVMGLRHNFRGSLVHDADTGLSSSVMDYADRQNRYKETKIGSHDLAAVRYGYFGETPATHLEFCTDEDMATDALCNQGDDGSDVAGYYHTATQQLLGFVTGFDFDFTDLNDSVTAMFKNYKKLSTLSSDQESTAGSNLAADLAAIAAASATSATQQANLAKLKDLATQNLGN